VRYRRNTNPVARVRDTEEERKKPHPKRRGGEAFSMAAH
jgi:hypothetical protein